VHPISSLLEALGNRALRFDPETCQRLAEFDGRHICLRVLRAPLEPLDILIAPSEAGLRRVLEPGAEADVTISASSVVFARLAMGRPLAAGEIQISGDVALGQSFQRALEHVHIDWEEALSRVTGDIVAHQIARAARAAASWGKGAAETLQLDTVEYLQEETRLLATHGEVDRFLDKVDRLRADVERLAKRLDRLGGSRA